MRATVNNACPNQSASINNSPNARQHWDLNMPVLVNVHESDR
ncbi:hypothetical protein ACIGBN_09100 [Marinomonas sp. NPDC078689]